MKKIILLTAVAVLALGSCKKDSKSTTPTTGTNTLTVTINGVSESFNGSLTASYTAEGGGGSGQSLGITGSRGSGATEELLQVAAYSSTTVSKGTYTVAEGNTTNFPVIVYYKNILSTSPLTYGTDVSGANASTITITSLTGTNVQGTFSGVLVDEGGGSDNQTLASGTFNVNITAK